MIDFRTVQFASVSAAVATTDGTLVAAVPSRKIRLLSLQCVPATTPAATLAINTKPTGSGTAVSPAYPLTAATLLNPSAAAGTGLCESNRGEGLSFTTGAGTNASTVFVSYVLI
jgi:hypothetical protein